VLPHSPGSRRPTRAPRRDRVVAFPHVLHRPWEISFRGASGACLLAATPGRCHEEELQEFVAPSRVAPTLCRQRSGSVPGIAHVRYSFVIAQPICRAVDRYVIAVYRGRRNTKRRGGDTARFGRASKPTSRSPAPPLPTLRPTTSPESVSTGAMAMCKNSPSGWSTY
jgi:hypothetical protein